MSNETEPLVRTAVPKVYGLDLPNSDQRLSAWLQERQDSGVPPDEDTDKAKLRLGEVRFLQGNLESAQFFVDSVLEHDPKNVDALTLLGEILIRRNNYPGAEQCFQQALAIPDQRSEALAWFTTRTDDEIDKEIRDLEAIPPAERDAVHDQDEDFFRDVVSYRKWRSRPVAAPPLSPAPSEPTRPPEPAGLGERLEPIFFEGRRPNSLALKLLGFEGKFSKALHGLKLGQELILDKPDMLEPRYIKALLGATDDYYADYINDIVMQAEKCRQSGLPFVLRFSHIDDRSTPAPPEIQLLSSTDLATEVEAELGKSNSAYLPIRDQALLRSVIVELARIQSRYTIADEAVDAVLTSKQGENYGGIAFEPNLGSEEEINIRIITKDELDRARQTPQAAPSSAFVTGLPWDPDRHFI